MKELTPRQKGVLAKLENRGAYMTARAAEQAWRKGQSYYLDPRNPARRGIVREFEKCNEDAKA